MVLKSIERFRVTDCLDTLKNWTERTAAVLRSFPPSLFSSFTYMNISENVIIHYSLPALEPLVF